MYKLLTKEDLAKRWQISQSTIDLYIKEGRIVPVKGLKVIRFNPRYIEEMEGVIPEAITWVEKKLERENQILREKLNDYERIFAEITLKCTSINSKCG